MMNDEGFSNSEIIAFFAGKTVMQVNRELAQELRRQNAHPAYISAATTTGSYIPARQRLKFDNDGMRHELQLWDAAVAAYMEQHPEPPLRPLTRFRLRALTSTRRMPTLLEIHRALEAKFGSMSFKQLIAWNPPFTPVLPQRARKKQIKG